MYNIFKTIKIKNIKSEDIILYSKLYDFVIKNINEIRSIFIKDPNYKTQDSLNIIDKLGEIKYPELSLLDRRNKIKFELDSIINELKQININ